MDAIISHKHKCTSCHYIPIVPITIQLFNWQQRLFFLQCFRWLLLLIGITGWSNSKRHARRWQHVHMFQVPAQSASREKVIHYPHFLTAMFWCFDYVNIGRC